MGNEQSSGVAASEASAAEVAAEAAAEAAAAEAAARQLSEGARALGEWARPLAERVQRAQRRLDSLEATVAAMAVFGADADQALKRLDTRVAALEAAVERALAAMFPRVETLLAHLEFLALPLGSAAVRTPSTAAPGLLSQSSATTSRESPAKSSFVSATPTPATTSASHLPGSSTADSSSRSITPKTIAPATKKHPSPHKPGGSNHRTTSSGSKATVSSSKSASNSKPASPNPKSTPSTSKIVLICRSKSSSFRSSSGNLHANPGRSRANSLTGEPSRSETQVPANVLQNSPDSNMPSSSFCVRRTTNTSEEISTQPDCSTSSKSVRSAMKTGSMSKTSIEGRKKKCSRPSSTTLNPSCDPPSSTTSTTFSESSTTSTSSTLLSSLPITSSVAPIPSTSQPMTSNSITSTSVPFISSAISTPTTSGDSSNSPIISLDSNNLSSVPRNKKAHPPKSSGERRRKILTHPTSSSFDKYSSSTALSTKIPSTSSIDNGTLPTNSSLVRTAISTDTVSPTTNPSSCRVTTSPSSTPSTSDAGIGSASSPNLSSGNSNSSSWEMVPFAKNSPGASDDSRVARSIEKSEVTKAVQADSVMAMGADVELSEAAVAESMEAAEAVMSRGATVGLSEATRAAEEATVMVNVTKPVAVAATTTAMAAESSEAARAAEATEIPAAVDVEDLSDAARAAEAVMEGRASRAVDDSTTTGAGLRADASDAVAEGRVEPPEVENAAEVLLQAARDGDMTRLEALLDEGRCEVNAACGVSGGTVAHWAALRGRADLLRLLLRRGADARRRDAARWTPLHAAAFGRSARCVELLVAAGAEVEGADRDGWTALHLAAVRGAAGATRALLAAGACTSARDRDGRTPAHLAATQALRSLLGGDGGADRAREGGGGYVADVCGARDARDARDI